MPTPTGIPTREEQKTQQREEEEAYQRSLQPLQTKLEDIRQKTDALVSEVLRDYIQQYILPGWFPRRLIRIRSKVVLSAPDRGRIAWESFPKLTVDAMPGMYHPQLDVYRKNWTRFNGSEALKEILLTILTPYLIEEVEEPT